MTRARLSRTLACAVSVSLMVVGSLAGHSLAYRAVAGDGDERRQLLERSGHGYLAYSDVAVAVCVTVALVGLVLVAVAARRGRACPAAVPVWPLALVLSLGFVAQEHVERLAATGAVQLEVVLEPTFALGLLLQLACVLVAACVARALLTFGQVIGRALAGRRAPRLANPSRTTSTSKVARPPRSLLGLGHAQRAPPVHP